MENEKRINLNYKNSGVNIHAGNELVERIKPLAARTHRPGVMAGLGGFGALFELPLNRYQQPILVSSTDGVGTKLKLAIEMGKHDTIGIDLVAMCVNDIIVQGAEPLYFLDYFATSALDVEVATQIVKGISEGCLLAGAALVGGETAEMPGIYSTNDYDLAGFAVGIVEKNKILDGSAIKAGDKLIALTSSGPHSNGFSLIRQILNLTSTPLDQPFGSKTLGEVLLEPTRIYVKSLLTLMENFPIKGLAHITGGGLTENLPRILPQGLQANIDLSSWKWPAIFQWLQQQGNVDQQEMLRTFNCGIGMIVCVSPENLKPSLEMLMDLGETAFEVGEINSSVKGSFVCYVP